MKIQSLQQSKTNYKFFGFIAFVAVAGFAAFSLGNFLGTGEQTTELSEASEINGDICPSSPQIAITSTDEVVFSWNPSSTATITGYNLRINSNPNNAQQCTLNADGRKVDWFCNTLVATPLSQCTGDGRSCDDRFYEVQNTPNSSNRIEYKVTSADVQGKMQPGQTYSWSIQNKAGSDTGCTVTVPGSFQFLGHTDQNSVPSLCPSDLKAEVNGNEVTFSWIAPANATTSDVAYNLRIDSNPSNMSQCTKTNGTSVDWFCANHTNADADETCNDSLGCDDRFYIAKEKDTQTGRVVYKAQNMIPSQNYKWSIEYIHLNLDGTQKDKVCRIDATSNFTPTGSGGSGTGVCGNLDTNGDNKVDILDFGGFKSVYNKTCSDNAPAIKCGPRDYNYDKIVDINDFSNFIKNYEKDHCTYAVID